MCIFVKEEGGIISIRVAAASPLRKLTKGKTNDQGKKKEEKKKMGREKKRKKEKEKRKKNQ